MMNEALSSSRRDFIKNAVTAGIALASSTHFGCAAPGKRSARDQTTPPAEAPPVAPPQTAYSGLRIAYIGLGGIGGQHLEETVKFGVQCPCFCDVDTTHMPRFAEAYPKARPYQDYRVMLDKEQQNIDAVMVAIPDHQHYPATIKALKLGKHVYTQKPLTHTVWEARQLTAAAQQYQVATQMGIQGHAGQGIRLVYEWVRSGVLGDVLEVHTWTDRPIWPQGLGRPEGADAIPTGLAWDVWLGPAPPRPFKENVYHPFNWRGWWDFGCGALGDMACHTMDSMFWALDPGQPTVVEPLASTLINEETFPSATVVRWEFPARGQRPAFKAYWYDGGLMPPFPPDFECDRRLPKTGNLFLGTKAALLVQGDYGESPRVFPESKMQEIGKPPQILERSPGHFAEWLAAAVGEQPLDYPKSNFAYAGPLTETILLGNIAVRLGRRLEWDGGKLNFTNLPEANRYLTKDYRAGWDL
jgi:predicted dehydrogenase